MPLDASVMAAVDTAAPVANHLGCHSIRWACVYTQPQAERWAETNLQLLGYRVWFPTRTVPQRDPVIPTKLNPSTRPLFPRYGFIAFDHRDTSWSPIRNTPGVVDLVRSGALPAYTNAAAVERLQGLLAQTATQQPETGQWASGDAVAPSAGAFTGHPAVVISVTGQRAIIAMLLFGELRQVSVDVASLVARE
jgi:transcription antitermination factor NusG